jgi:ectoine hydroxylase-related dioxygenase (phytanoyl-CoA dioxygenase family)
MTHDCSIDGRPVPPDVLSSFVDSTEISSDHQTLAESFDKNGYVFVKGLIPQESVNNARREVFGRLAEMDEIREPAIEGIATGRSRRVELVGDLGVFWQSVSEGQAIRRVSHATETKSLLDTLFNEESLAHDYSFLRPGVKGRFTFLHFDYPFFSRGSKRVVTAWTAIGPVPKDEGALFVLENSHSFDDLIADAVEIDYDSSSSPRVQMTDDLVELARARSSRLLTTDFDPGDIVLFSMTTMHGAFDNNSELGRARLTVDVRWQPAAEPVDERYIGPNPKGTTGAGYGELNGAKPLIQEWHVR